MRPHSQGFQRVAPYTKVVPEIYSAAPCQQQNNGSLLCSLLGVCSIAAFDEESTSFSGCWICVLLRISDKKCHCDCSQWPGCYAINTIADHGAPTPTRSRQKGLCQMSSNNIYQYTCEKCQQSYSSSAEWGSKRFCSRACANSRVRSQELRIRVSQTLKETYSNTRIKRKTASCKRPHPVVQKTCPACSAVYSSRKLTCSRACFINLARQNALKQEKHGGGHKGRYKGITCDSTYELAFFVWHLDHNIDIRRCDSVYTYTYKDKLSSYKPDFVVEGQEVEIKGFMSARAQAKLDQNPHVFVIDKVNIKPFIQYVKQTYGVKDLRDLYDSKDHQIPCNHCSQLFTPGYKSQLYCSVSCATSIRHKSRRLAGRLGFEPR